MSAWSSSWESVTRSKASSFRCASERTTSCLRPRVVVAGRPGRRAPRRESSSGRCPREIAPSAISARWAASSPRAARAVELGLDPAAHLRLPHVLRLRQAPELQAPAGARPRARCRRRVFARRPSRAPRPGPRTPETSCTSGRHTTRRAAATNASGERARATRRCHRPDSVARGRRRPSLVHDPTLGSDPGTRRIASARGVPQMCAEFQADERREPAADGVTHRRAVGLQAVVAPRPGRSRPGPSGGIPNGSLSPCTTRVGTATASSSSQAALLGPAGRMDSGNARQSTPTAPVAAAVRHATRAPEERPPASERQAAQLSVREATRRPRATPCRAARAGPASDALRRGRAARRARR